MRRIEREAEAEVAAARGPADCGYALVELLVVFVVLGILVAVAVPAYRGQKAKAAMATTRTDLHNLVQAEAAFFADHDRYAPAHELAGAVDYRTSPDGGASVIWSSTSGFCVAATNRQASNQPTSALAGVGFAYETLYFDSRAGSPSTTPCVAPPGATTMDGGYWDAAGAR